MNLYMNTHVYTYEYIYIYIYTCIHVYMYICIYVSICLCGHIHTCKQGQTAGTDMSDRDERQTTRERRTEMADYLTVMF
jgi:hypothetical protein